MRTVTLDGREVPLDLVVGIVLVGGTVIGLLIAAVVRVLCP